MGRITGLLWDRTPRRGLGTSAVRSVSVPLHETLDCETQERTNEGESATLLEFPDGRWQACWPPRTKKEAN